MSTTIRMESAKNEKRRGRSKTPDKPKAGIAQASKSSTRTKVELSGNLKTAQKVKLVAVAYSHVEREWFPTQEAYEAEAEVESRAQTVLEVLAKLNIPAKGYPSDPYFITNLLVDNPELVLNLVDTLRGKESLQTSIPAALELTNIPYTGAGMRGLVIGNDRNLFKQLLIASNVPTPEFQYIQRKGTNVDEKLGLPLIVKLNESGGSVGIDNNAVRETLEDAEQRVDEMIDIYKLPVIVERFIDGPEITVAVFDDGTRRHVFLAEKKFNMIPDGKHAFTSLESYQDPQAYTFEKVKDKAMADKIEKLTVKAFAVLHNKDYAKFDIRVDQETGTPYFTDCNPNTAFGPSLGLPFTEILAMYKITFEDVLISLISKYARKIAQS